MCRRNGFRRSFAVARSQGISKGGGSEGLGFVVTINTASASDGVPLHDQTLPGAEWFDAANHPTATFRTSSIRSRGGNAYEARGTLTIKGRPIEVRLPFTLTLSGDRATMDGALSIDRGDANLGMASDPDAEFVSHEIAVRVHVEAQRAP